MVLREYTSIIDRKRHVVVPTSDRAEIAEKNRLGYWPETISVAETDLRLDVPNGLRRFE